MSDTRIAWNLPKPSRSRLHSAMSLAPPSPTQRLERLVVRGTAHGVHSGLGTVSFQLVPYDPIDDRRAPIPVEIRTQLGAGQLADGDEVEVTGVWDGNTLDADEVVSFSADSPAERTILPFPRRIAAAQGTETQ